MISSLNFGIINLKIITLLIFLTTCLGLSIYLFSENMCTAKSTHSKTEKIETETKSSYNAPLITEGISKKMCKPFDVLIQYITPQHALSRFAGWLSNCEKPWLKNYLIRYFLGRFDINMKEALIEDPFDYPSFNAFFTRKLKPELRPIASGHDIASPVDGFISQIGKIENHTLVQAKGHFFNLTSLLGGSEHLAKLFSNGEFATLYLSPKDYHRVHMPIDGKLIKTIYIPGNLFSVSQKTVQFVPNLFARNERLVCIFDTDKGPMAVILVGAMVVGSIDTVWPLKMNRGILTEESYNKSLTLAKGAELGLFKLGSTVIVLFANDKVIWNKELHENSVIRMGQAIGQTLDN